MFPLLPESRKPGPTVTQLESDYVEALVMNGHFPPDGGQGDRGRQSWKRDQPQVWQTLREQLQRYGFNQTDIIHQSIRLHTGSGTTVFPITDVNGDTMLGEGVSVSFFFVFVLTLVLPLAHLTVCCCSSFHFWRQHNDPTVWAPVRSVLVLEDTTQTKHSTERKVGALFESFLEVWTILYEVTWEDPI